MFGLFRKKDAAPQNIYIRLEDSNVFRIRVRTKRFKEIVELRFTKSADIGVNDEGGYIYRKVVVSSQHFERGEVTVRFGPRYQILEVMTEGCEAIPTKDW